MIPTWLLTIKGIIIYLLQSLIEYHKVQREYDSVQEYILDQLVIKLQKQCDISKKLEIQIINNSEKSKITYQNIKRKTIYMNKQTLYHIIISKDDQNHHSYEKQQMENMLLKENYRIMKTERDCLVTRTDFREYIGNDGNNIDTT